MYFMQKLNLAALKYIFTKNILLHDLAWGKNARFTAAIAPLSCCLLYTSPSPRDS